MDTTPDYSKCSMRELQDVAARIDKAKYPDRYALVLQEIERRESSGDDAATAKPKRLITHVLRADVTYLIGGAIGFFIFLLTPFSDSISPDSPGGMLEGSIAIFIGALLAGIVRRIYLGKTG